MPDKINPSNKSQMRTSQKKNHPVREMNTVGFGPSFDIGQIFNLLYMIKERWIWGASLGLLLAFLYAFVNLREEPVYASTAYLLIDSRTEQIIDVQEVIDNSVSSGGDLDNHLRQMESRTFRKSVSESFSADEVLQLQAVYLLGNTEGSAPSIGSMVGGIRVYRNGQVFNIVARHRDPSAAAMLANRFAAQYITNIITRTGVGNESALVFLEKQADSLREKIADSEQSLTEYRREHNLVSLEESQNIIVDRLKSINAEKTNVRLEQLQLETSVEQVQSAIDQSEDLTEIPVIASYGTIPSILARKKAYEAELSALNLKYLERHPKIIETTQQIVQIEEQLALEIDRAVRDLLNQKDAIDRRIVHLNGELQAAESEALTLDSHAIEYNVLKRQLDSDRQTFDTIINRLNETNLSSKLDTTNFRILDEAVPAGSPIKPVRSKITSVSCFIFVVCLIGVPLAIEILDNRLKSVYDVEHTIGKPLLTDLPHLKSMDENRSGACVVLDESNEEISEAFRAAYSALHMESEVDFPKVILVTSTRPGEGKSFVAANLAPTMAKHGLNCLLIDTDLRRPVLHKSFGLKNDVGIVGWYDLVAANSGELSKSSDELLQDERLGIVRLANNFDLLRAGGATKRTTELLDSTAFERLMNAAKGKYDVVIMDTPPVSLFTDSLFLSEFADEVVYVARYNKISRHKVRHFVNKLDGELGKVVGIVINGRNSKKGQRYGYNYDYGYSSYSSDYKEYQKYSETS